MRSFKLRFFSAFASAALAVGSFTVPELSVPASAEDIPILVAIGDSYAAGEGIEPFFGQNKANGDPVPAADKVKDEDWLAHRSTKVWSGMLKLDGVKGTLSDHRGTNWYFAASSGAEIKHLTSGQPKHYYITENGSKYTGDAVLSPQFDIFGGLTLTDNDFVTVSIGGNDVGFFEIISTALMKKADVLKKAIDVKKKDFNDHIRADLTDAYKKIARKAGNANIIVTGYPYLIAKSKSISGEKANILKDAVDWLDGEIKSIVDELRADGIKIHFVDVRPYFKGHEAYTSDPYINELSLGAGNQDLDKKVYVNGNSIHPNEKGSAAYATAVQNMIDEISGAQDTAAKADNDIAASAGLNLQIISYIVSNMPQTR